MSIRIFEVIHQSLGFKEPMFTVFESHARSMAVIFFCPW